MKIIVFLACLSMALAFPRLNNPKLIVGGIESPRGSRPYQVALSYSDQGQSQFCGGTLVHRKWVVTAAHCASQYDVYVGLGWHNLADTGFEGVAIKGKWVTHPNYNPQTFDDDIAMIEMDSEVTLTDKIQMISIAAANSDVADGDTLMVSGWGSIQSGGYPRWELRQVVVDGVDRNKCNSDYGGIITDNMICASASGKDACQGDSGGPLVSNFDENKHISGVTLEGVVSWGYGCADPSYPGVYSRPANYCSWLNTVSNGDVSCKN